MLHAVVAALLFWGQKMGACLRALSWSRHCGMLPVFATLRVDTNLGMAGLCRGARRETLFFELGLRIPISRVSCASFFIRTSIEFGEVIVTMARCHFRTNKLPGPGSPLSQPHDDVALFTIRGVFRCALHIHYTIVYSTTTLYLPSSHVRLASR